MNPTLQIKYSKKELRISLLFGTILVIIFILYTILRSDSYFGYAYLATGILLLATYIYKKIFNYATIKNGVLIKHAIIPKRIQLDQIIDVFYFSGKYKLMTKNSTLLINTMVIDKKSIEELKIIIKQLNLSKP